MRNSHKKLIAASLLAVISVTLMVSVSYAWYTLAGNPALTGVEITIAGDNTIMLAPDMIEEVNGEIVHYPGFFEKTLDVSSKSYKYLQELSGLSPVSTADGIHWFVPVTDADGVQRIRELSDFHMDTTLEYANVTGDGDKGYAYLDFWIVSPMDECTIRLSVGDDGLGSYLVGMPEVLEDVTKPSGYTLDMSGNTVSACARVGFLVNDDPVTTNEAMNAYIDSDNYNSKHKSLKGIYQEPEYNIGMNDYDFVIYEPNAELHPGKGTAYQQTKYGLDTITGVDGQYMVTRPIAYVDGQRQLVDVVDRLTIQKKSLWTLAAESEETKLEQMFQAYVAGIDTSNMTLEEIADRFYEGYMRDQYSQYVTPGKFFKSSWVLYLAGDYKTVSADVLENTATANVTNDAVIVELKRDVPQRIRMYVWLEGQDADCNSDAAMQSFALNIELAGSTEG